MALIYKDTETPNGADNIYNGIHLDKIIYDGIEVWRKAVPYSVSNFASYNWLVSRTQNNSSCSHTVSSNLVELNVCNPSGSTGTWSVYAIKNSKGFPTNGCNKVRVSYATWISYGSDTTVDFQINNTSLPTKTTGYKAYQTLTLNVPTNQNTFFIELYGNAHGDSYNVKHMEINKIEFYN